MSKQSLCKYPNVTFYNLVFVDESCKIGEGTGIGEVTYIGKDVEIGKNCRIMQHVTVGKGTIIGDDVFIGPNTSILNDKYPPTHEPQGFVRIGYNAIIGGGCTILPNVIVHHDSVVGAGSVVTKDVQPRSVVCGNPAKYMMERKDYNLKQVFIK